VPIFQYKNIKINYIDKGEGVPLVLLMGFGTQMRAWTFQIAYFKERLRVIALDNRGTGRSSRPDYPYSMEMFVKDLEHLLKHLNVNEKVFICGISMGGMIAQQFALKHPKKVKGLILIATSAKADPQNLVESMKMINSLPPEQQLKTRASLLYSKSFQKRIFKDEQLRRFFLNGMGKNRTTLRDYRNQAAALKEHDTREQLKEIPHPSLIIVGSEDTVLPPSHSKYLGKHLENSKLIILEGLAHGLIVEAAQKVNRIVWKFIQNFL
jgi:pimeloyl-ACP methyl ester carboxylesterase